jgi:hypothetical protein
LLIVDYCQGETDRLHLESFVKTIIEKPIKSIGRVLSDHHHTAIFNSSGQTIGQIDAGVKNHEKDKMYKQSLITSGLSSIDV